MVMQRTKRRFAALLRSFLLVLSGRVISIPAHLVTNEYGFSMAPEGWNYFRALIAEYDSNPSIKLEDTIFYRFFQDERVRSVQYINDLLFLHDPDKQKGHKFFLGTYPWGHWQKSASQTGGIPYGRLYDRIEGKKTRDIWGYRRNPWYDPGDRYPLEIEWNQTICLYHSITREGYSPFWHGFFPEVTQHIRRDGQRRAVRYNGQHRLAIMSYLSNKNLDVVLGSDSLQVIRESEVEQWYYVKNGLCSPEQASEIFNAFFELNGRERINYLNLPSVY